MTVKEFFEVFKSRKYMVTLELSVEESVDMSEDSEKMIEAFGDIVVGEFFVTEEGRPFIRPKTITTILRENHPTGRLEVLK